MSYGVGDGCNSCGMCLRACPKGAMRTTPHGPVPVEVVSLDCNDCGKCAVVCPTSAIAPDPAWAVCWGRGCPLSSSRFEGWTCAEGRRRCVDCGNSMWKEPGVDGWLCFRCDHGRKVICPKVRKATALAGGPPVGFGAR